MTDFEQLLCLDIPRRLLNGDTDRAARSLDKLAAAASALAPEKAAGFDEDKVEKARAVVDKTSTEHDMDGIYVHVNPAISLAWVDVMDWGESETGRVLEMRLKRLFQDVVMRNESARPRGPDWVQLWPPRTKEAASYLLSGSKVQGVGLREKLHGILDEMKVPGLAVNDARTGTVQAVIDAAQPAREHALNQLANHLAEEGHDLQWQEQPGKVKLKRVVMDPRKRQRMYERQGFTKHLEQEDPDAWIANWITERYRLPEPRGGVQEGYVPHLAQRQLMGLEPIYEGQLLRPQQFGTPYWAKRGADGPPPLLWTVKRAAPDDSPFTVAVDLDGTIAEKEEPFSNESIGAPRERAVEWLRRFRDAGARVIIFTVRGDTELVKDWLDDNDVPYDYVNENPDQPEDGSGKLWADAYWDDKAIDASDPDSGAEVLRRIEAGRDGEEEEEGPRPCVAIIRHTRIIMSAPAIIEAMEDA